jgi:deoxyribose-phosphate aldolase
MNELAGLIDHTMLSMQMQRTDVLRLCDEALQYGFAAVCVPSYFTTELARRLSGTPVKACTVIGFPFGYQPVGVKIRETEIVLEQGAQEIDLVINLAAWFSADYRQVADEINAITEMSHDSGALIKVIIETGYLNADHLAALCDVCSEAGVDFVKTSTGFGATGAQIAVVKEMRRLLPEWVQIKASGGIRDREFALGLMAAGARRIGTSSGVKMMET